MNRPYISDLQLEQLAQGVLPKAEEKVLREALEADKDAQSRFQAIKKNNKELLQEFTPDEVDAEVARRLRVFKAEDEKSETSSRFPVTIGLRVAFSAVAVCALVALFLFFPVDKDQVEHGSPGYRIKGTPELLVHRVIKHGAEQLEEGAKASQGDRIQLSVIRSGFRYATVVSIDGNGQVVLHFPRDGGDGEMEESDGPFSLPNSYELDDAPDFERFFLVVSEDPINPLDVVDGAHDLLADPDKVKSADINVFEDDTVQSSFLLNKVE